MNEAQRNAILEDAKNQLANNKGILIDSPIIQKFVKRRKEIDGIAAKKNPLVKEYIDIHKEAEKNQNTTIGRMTRAMKNIAAQHMIYSAAMEMSADEEEKQYFQHLMDELENHPAVAAYEKYVEGLSYLSGEIYEVSPEVEAFFRDELAVPLQEHKSKYEKYRLGDEEYLKREPERLDKLEAEMNTKLLELEARKKELEAKEDKESKTYRDLINDINTLENDIKRIPRMKEELFYKTSPETQEKLDVYQKSIAKMKARELYSKQAIGFDLLTNQFLGDYLKSKDKADIYPYRDRLTPAVFCIGAMLNAGYKLEDIMDPTALLEEKKKIGQDYIDHRQAKDVQWYVKSMYAGANAMMDAFKEYVKEHKDELKTEQDLAMHAGTLGILSMACFDMSQELNHCSAADKGKLYKTEEEYDLLQDKICGYDCGAGLGNTWEVKYDITSLPSVTIAAEMKRQLRIKMLLEEIQKDNPDLDAVMIHSIDQKSLDNQLGTLPEFKKLFNGEFDIFISNISKESAKQLAFMQSMEFVDKNNIRFDRAKHPTEVTKFTSSTVFDIPEGETLAVAVSCNGKQLVATNIPVRVEDCFKNIESKDIRGKRKDNSEEFNKMMDEYDKALGNIGYEKTDAHNLDELKELKKAAIAYLNVKRAQKGHNTDKPLNFKVDMQMLGREKGGKSIFTSKGKDRYEFALEIVTNIVNLENAYGKNEMQKQSAEITQSENGDMEIKEVEQESSEL